MLKEFDDKFLETNEEDIQLGYETAFFANMWNVQNKPVPSIMS